MSASTPRPAPDFRSLFDATLSDGYQIARTVRSRPHGPKVRLIAVSGFSRGSDRGQSRAAGFDAHLAKPLPLAELVELLEGDLPDV